MLWNESLLQGKGNLCFMRNRGNCSGIQRRWTNLSKACNLQGQASIFAFIAARVTQKLFYWNSSANKRWIELKFKVVRVPISWHLLTPLVICCFCLREKFPIRIYGSFLIGVRLSSDYKKSSRVFVVVASCIFISIITEHPRLRSLFCSYLTADS